MLHRIILCFIVLWILGALPALAAETADVIYFGGPIVTMVSDGAQVEALAVADGNIVATGSKKDVMALKGDETKLVDLKGKTLMPGFIDPHSHVSLQSAKFSTVNLDPVPIGDVKSIADIQRKLREYIAKEKPAPGKWVFGWGYDDTNLKEMRHPNRKDLDAVSTTNPIFLIHISCHLGAANSLALKDAGVTAETPDPEGGRYQREPGSKEPNGVVEEAALMKFVASVPPPTKENALKMLQEGLQKYAASGITTACDGASSEDVMNLFRALDARGELPIDIVAYPLYKSAKDSTVDDIAKNWRHPARLRPGGLKLVLDGSIQGYTAYLTQPYYKELKNGEPEPDSCESDAVTGLFYQTANNTSHDTKPEEEHQNTDRGYPGMSQKDVTHWVQVCKDRQIPFQAHCNGDAAVDMLLTAIEAVYKNDPQPDLRNIIVHAQTIREDQLDKAAKYGLVPSFFPIHVVFWGDRHRDIFLGPKRAARIDPSRSALNRDMKITLHHDAPVAGIGMLPVASAAVNRITSSGKLLGPDQRITPYEALRAITKDAAWQYHEEDRKGTLEQGKLADIVILDKNPMTVDPKTIGDIQVLETIKEGKTVYKAE
ncbi:amidohydrolase [Desulfovibrio inopinatus]|uniref:amidohydrolase n=1 Tax=Desulfovibrio inopinatus TaxID=102109 RepID=UPI0003F6924B|nr:amidohydrolase [Desulfovibrio inopinatus]